MPVDTSRLVDSLFVFGDGRPALSVYEYVKSFGSLLLLFLFICLFLEKNENKEKMDFFFLFT